LTKVDWSNVIQSTCNGDVSWSKCQLAEPVMLPSVNRMGAKLGEGVEAIDFQPNYV